MYKPYPSFTGKPVQCKLCFDVIFSKFDGQYVGCKCNAIAVDQTPYYERRIGEPENFLNVETKE